MQPLVFYIFYCFKIEESLSIEYLFIPGIDLIDSILFLPSLTNIGSIRSLAEKCYFQIQDF